MIVENFLVIFLMSSLILIMEAKYTITSLLGLIVVFICGSCAFIANGSAFVGLIFIIVYIGAVGMLFLFMIMLLNSVISKQSILDVENICFLILGFLIIWDYLDFIDSLTEVRLNSIHWIDAVLTGDELFNIATVLYDVHGISVILLGVLLFKSIIIAIDVAKTRM